MTSQFSDMTSSSETEPLRTQDPRGLRTLEDPEPLKTQDPRERRTLEDLLCLETKCIIKQTDDRIKE